MIGYGLSLPYSRRVTWSPLRLPGCIGCWDAADSLTTYGPDARPAVGEPVVRSIDRSPMGNDLIQLDGNRQPTLAYFNGVDASAGYAWEFNGSNSMLTSLHGQGMVGNAATTVFFVYRNSNPALASTCMIFGFGPDVWTQSRGLYFHHEAPSMLFRYTEIGAVMTPTPNFNYNTTPNIIGFRKVADATGADKASFTINGIDRAITGAVNIPTAWQGTEKFVLGNYHPAGASNPFLGVLGMALVFDRRLTDSEYTKVLAWIEEEKQL